MLIVYVRCDSLPHLADVTADSLCSTQTQGHLAM